jgi:hypothetical protein
MPCERIVLATSKPSRPGSITSRTITSNGSPVARVTATLPSPAVSTEVALRRQPVAQRQLQAGLVFNEEKSLL